MKRDKEAAGNVGNFLLPLLEYQNFCLSDSFLYHWSDDHGDDHFMRSAGINGITQIPRAALKVESATMQNHTVPKR